MIIIIINFFLGEVTERDSLLDASRRRGKGKRNKVRYSITIGLTMMMVVVVMIVTMVMKMMMGKRGRGRSPLGDVWSPLITLCTHTRRSSS